MLITFVEKVDLSVGLGCTQIFDCGSFPSCRAQRTTTAAHVTDLIKAAIRSHNVYDPVLTIRELDWHFIIAIEFILESGLHARMVGSAAAPSISAARRQFRMVLGFRLFFGGIEKLLPLFAIPHAIQHHLAHQLGCPTRNHGRPNIHGQGPWLPFLCRA